jgi:membrane protein YdbS with pleckstrin-like domain
MRERLRALLLRMLRVPAAPRQPTDESGPVQIFRAAPGYLKYSRVLWVGKQVGALIGLVVGVGVITGIQRGVDNVYVSYVLWAVEAFAWTGFLLQLGASWMMLRLDYELRWYIVGERSLRIREGLLNLREQTLAFANIQQISVRQGPLQRLFGIADVEVRTAGGGGESGQQHPAAGGSGGNMHTGHFRGVANAAEIRDVLRQRVGRHRDTGLGDPDELAHARPPAADTVVAPAAVPAGSATALLDAARELRTAARALRG